jgi:8-oxo-dGTP diphosphatase
VKAELPVAPQTSDRIPVDVAVGVLFDGEQRFMLTSRPAGKVYAAYGEFLCGELEAV